MIDLLLNKLGFNPDDLKKQVQDATDNFNKVIAHFDTRFNVIQKQNIEIMELLEKIHAKDNPIVAVVPKQLPFNGENHD